MLPINSSDKRAATEDHMASINHDIDSDRNDMIKWISGRHSHIPTSEVEFLIGIPPFGMDDDEWGVDDEE